MRGYYLNEIKRLDWKIKGVDQRIEHVEKMLKDGTYATRFYDYAKEFGQEGLTKNSKIYSESYLAQQLERMANYILEEEIGRAHV